ncbi:Mitogen-activated protein kinase kinase kinase [Bertholletia excelsa]
MNEKGDKFYNLLLEYASGGSLERLIRKYGGQLQESKVRRYTKSILCGIKHIHQNGYAHRDLKPANILLVPQESGYSSELIAKICDFGLAKRAESGKESKYFIGTPMYTSPEAVVESIQEAPSDIWALGCVVLEMFTGRRVWEDGELLDSDELLEKIRYEWKTPKIPHWISDEAKEFLKACFMRKPEDRSTAEELLNLPFVAQLQDWEDARPSARYCGQVCHGDVGDGASCSSLSSTSEDEDDSETESESESDDSDLDSCSTKAVTQLDNGQDIGPSASCSSSCSTCEEDDSDEDETDSSYDNSDDDTGSGEARKDVSLHASSIFREWRAMLCRDSKVDITNCSTCKYDNNDEDETDSIDDDGEDDTRPGEAKGDVSLLQSLSEMTEWMAKLSRVSGAYIPIAQRERMKTTSLLKF